MSITNQEQTNVRIKELYEAGYSIRQVGEMVGLSRCTTRSRMKQMGVVARSRGGHDHCRLSYKELELTALMYASGMSASEIARAFGLSKSGVQYRLTSFGVSIRTKSEASKLARARDSRGLKNDDSVEAVARMYTSDLKTIREIVRETGMSKGSVSYRLAAAGVRPRRGKEQIAARLKRESGPLSRAA